MGNQLPKSLSRLQAFLIVLLGFFLIVAPSLALALAEKNEHALLVEVIINHQRTPSYQKIFLDRSGNIWIGQDVIDNYHIHHQGDTQTFDEQLYYSLRSYQGVHFVLDTATLNLYVDLPAQNFEEITLKPETMPIPAIRPKQQGNYLNYDINSTAGKLNQTPQVVGQFEQVYFNPYGVENFSWISGNYNDRPGFVRLDTTWTLDQPEKIATWRIGDSSTSALIWGGAVRFGGIQYATNFQTQPTLITYPLPSIRGEAVLPSALSLLVNNQVIQQRQLPSSTYVFNDIPVVTGAGSLVVSTKNIIGQTQVLIVPYYVAPQLLKPGLDDFSYELGSVRSNYGLQSFDYTEAVGVGTYRRGISDHLTIGGHAEALPSQQTLGSETDFLWQR